MIAAWRIGTDAPLFTAEDMTGTGAKLSGGRWNRTGNAVIYSATTIALACLETVVHLKSGGLPINRYLVRIDIPDEVWSAREAVTYLTAPVGWDALPAGRVSLDLGDKWLASNKSAILLVPSIVVPEEQNILINPAHPDAHRITAIKTRKWLYDPRIAPI